MRVHQRPANCIADVGYRIFLFRRDLKISQPKLAALSGISLSTLKRIELGKTNPGLNEIFTLARIFNRPASDFFIPVSNLTLQRHTKGILFLL